jgi:hypothetical protein
VEEGLRKSIIKVDSEVNINTAQGEALTVSYNQYHVINNALAYLNIIE